MHGCITWVLAYVPEMESPQRILIFLQGEIYLQVLQVGIPLKIINLVLKSKYNDLNQKIRCCLYWTTLATLFSIIEHHWHHFILFFTLNVFLSDLSRNVWSWIHDQYFSLSSSSCTSTFYVSYSSSFSNRIHIVVSRKIYENSFRRIDKILSNSLDSMENHTETSVELCISIADRVLENIRNSSLPQYNSDEIESGDSIPNVFHKVSPHS